MKITKDLIVKIENEAKKYFENANGCHDWTHVERVRKNALKIGKKENADLKIIEIAALLHDIAKNSEMKKRGGFCHAETGAKMAEKILQKYKLSQEIINEVTHAIKTHRFRNKHQPETIEAKVLQDADRLDAIGAVGVARDFLFAGNKGSKILYTGREKELVARGLDYAYTKDDSAVLEYEVKLKHIKDLMLTRAGKKLARGRDKFMKNFFQRFWQEVKGVK